MSEQLQFPFPSLDFPGRMTLMPQEIAEKLGISVRQVVDLIIEGKLRAMNLASTGAARAYYRVAVEDYRNFVLSTLTAPADRLRLLKDLPRATLVQLQAELKQFLAA